MDFSSAHLACRITVESFFHFVDARMFEQAAYQFAQEGVWHRHGDTLVGPQQVLAALTAKDDRTVERHLVSTTHVEPVTADTWCGSSYIQIVRGTRGAAPIPATSVTLGDFRFRCRAGDERVLLTHLESVPVFRLPDSDRPGHGPAGDV